MKKNYFLVLVLCFFNVLSAQVINFPDANFKARLLLIPDIDTNNNGEIDLSEALNVKYLNVADAQISNLSGIENFTNLIQLDCTMNKLTSLDLSNLILLENLNCGYNLLENIILGQSKIKNLECYNNKLTSLNLSTFSNLNSLNCNNNALSV